MAAITLTGADERTPIRELVALADAGAEIGLLYTHDQEGRHRYPSLEWIATAVQALDGRAAVHVCGARGRFSFANGILDDDVMTHIRRVQINGHVQPKALEIYCSIYPDHVIITQHTDANADLVGVDAPNHALLVDASGGRGIVPGEWQAPETTKAVGFAGGLSADNLGEQLPRIMAVARAGAWIDCEASLRDGDDWFSVARSRLVLEAFRRHMGDAP